MQQVEEYRIGRHVISLVFRDGIAPASPYSLFLANHISAMPGQTAIDIGTGCGILGIVARLHGAARVYIVDTYDTAIEVALENARRNAVQDGFIHVPIGPNMIPLPQGETVDLVISNPAQLPLRRTDRANSPFYAGPDGREMIDALIKEAPRALSRSGRLLMVHNSLSNFSKSVDLMKSAGLEPRVLAEQTLAFRPFIDRVWLDELGGIAKGLYSVRDGEPYETLRIVEATLP